MFGRKAKLPIDSLIETISDNERISTDYVKDFETRIKSSMKIADAFREKSKIKLKQQFDKKAKASEIRIGDNVL